MATTISNFSWQEFDLVELPYATVKELHDTALGRGPDPFVVYDPAERHSALVLPSAVIHAVERHSIPGTIRVSEAGLFDLLRRDQIMVSALRPAVEVARLVADYDIPCVIAVDQIQKPVGAFIPSVVTERLPNVTFLRSRRAPKTQRLISGHIDLTTLPDVILAIDEEFGDFHSEQINQTITVPYVCGGNESDGPHVVNSCPCKYHPTSSCGRSGV